MPSFPVLSFSGQVSSNGNNTIVTNPFKTVAQAQTHGQQRPAVVRVHSYFIQNASGVAVNIAWADSTTPNIVGPFDVPAQPSNWSERATTPGFLFETTRTNTTGNDLVLNLNTATNVQVYVEYTFSFVPGRVNA